VAVCFGAMCWAVSGPPWARRKHHGLVETPDLFSGFFPSTRNSCLFLCRRGEPHLPTGLPLDLAPWITSIQEAESACAWPSDQCLCLVPAVHALSGGVSVQKGSMWRGSAGTRQSANGARTRHPLNPRCWAALRRPATRAKPRHTVRTRSVRTAPVVRGANPPRVRVPLHHIVRHQNAPMTSQQCNTLRSTSLRNLRRVATQKSSCSSVTSIRSSVAHATPT
jgi:hypothetical protein